MPSLYVVLAYVLCFAAEFWRHYNNYNFLICFQVEERKKHLMQWLYSLFFLALVFAIVEIVVTGPVKLETATQLYLLTGIGVCFVIRLWTIASLGPRWTMRNLEIPEEEPVRSGPYRFFRHPEYTTRAIDGALVLLLLGSQYAPIVYFVSFVILARLAANAESESSQESDLVESCLH